MSPSPRRQAPKPSRMPEPSSEFGNKARQVLAVVLVVVGLITLLVPGAGLAWWLGAIWLVAGIVIGWNDIAALARRG